MIYATHIPKRERKRALRDVYAMEPVAPKFNPWSSCPITFDRRDHPTSIRHGGFAALVLDPIGDGFHPTRAWHLELEVCIMRHRVELCKRGSSEQSVIAAAERDYVED